MVSYVMFLVAFCFLFLRCFVLFGLVRVVSLCSGFLPVGILEKLFGNCQNSRISEIFGNRTSKVLRGRASFRTHPKAIHVGDYT